MLKIGDRVKEVVFLGQYPKDAVLTVVEIVENDGVVSIGTQFKTESPLFSDSSELVKVD